MSGQLDTRLGERYYKDDAAVERQHIDAIVAMIHRAIEGHFNDAHGKEKPALARRDAHAMDNGCVRALFRIDHGLPKDLQHGVFQPGREYRAWIRYSNGNSEPKPRWWPDARGMAIKLFGVEGDKLMDDEKLTQDFILISHPVFFVNDLERYLATLEAFLRGGLVNQYVISPFKLNLREMILAVIANLHIQSNPLLDQYWSMVPYRLGTAETGTAVKYTAKPRLADKPSLIAKLATVFGANFSLKQAMADTLGGTEVWFDFYVQRWKDERRTPVEDSRVEWREADAPLEHIGEIIVPMQDIMSDAQARFCENLSISPWHSLADHKPLGLVNRVRKVAYHEISALRHRLNKAPLQEPTGDEVFGR